jgi:hypothetical protein
MQEGAVFVIVALAAGYAASRLMPRALRIRLARTIVSRARRRWGFSDRGSAAIERHLSSGGCGSCDSCGGCPPGPAAGSGSAALRYVPDAARHERALR